MVIHGMHTVLTNLTYEPVLIKVIMCDLRLDFYSKLVGA
jgi:hypothetical protein